MNDKLAIVMPVYNEEAVIGSVLDKWANALDSLGIDYQLHPYNDGSRDGSLGQMKAAAERHPGHIVPHADTQRHGLYSPPSDRDS